VRREKRGSREAGDQGGASVERLIFGRGGERISLARIVLAMAGRPTPGRGDIVRPIKRLLAWLWRHAVAMARRGRDRGACCRASAHHRCRRAPNGARLAQWCRAQAFWRCRRRTAAALSTDAMHAELAMLEGLLELERHPLVSDAVSELCALYKS